MMRRLVPGLILLCLCVASTAGAQPDAELFNDQELGELRLYLHPRDWRALKDGYLDNTYYPADVQWKGALVPSVGIRSRGAGSRSSTKPGLRVDIDYYTADQEFLGLKSFVLDNNVTDASLLRERLSMLFFARMGLHAPRERHVVLYVNDELAGVYSVVESLDKRFLARVFGGEAGHVENDGHLFEYKFTFPYYFSYLGDDLAVYSTLFEARTREHDSPVDLWGPFEEFTRRLEEDAPLGFAASVEPFIDTRQAVRYLAVESFLAEFDGLLGRWGANNFYVYRFEGSTRMHLLPWDKDQTFRSANQSIWRNVEENVLVRRLLEVPSLRALYLDALGEAASIADSLVGPDGQPVNDRDATDVRGWLRSEIEREAGQIRDAAKADANRWHAPGMFDQEVERLLEFADTRGPFVMCEVQRARQPSTMTECVAPDRLPIFAPE